MKNVYPIALVLVISTFFSEVIHGQSTPKEQWVDSVMATLDVDEKIGQIFMIRAFSKEDPAHINSVKEQIKKYKVGGACFFQGHPEKQAHLVNEYQKLSDIPMMMAIDGEWGLGMRFPKDAISFPKQLTIGAINDQQLIYSMGLEIGRQCKQSGITMNFAPDVDINNNAANPVINIRSFGEDRYNVSAKAYAYMQGMQDAGILACAKHFPGHGDTAVDSHHDLPVIPHDRKRLDSIELYPFKMMIKQGISSIMVAHLQVPALDDRPNRPTTVSDRVATGLLRDEMGFEGLIITDAMEMKAVTKHFPPGEADVAAFLAGNDIILLPEDIHAAVKQVKSAVADGTITMSRLEASVRRVLGAKYDIGLHQTGGTATPTGILDEVNNASSNILKSKIYEKAITLVSNNQSFLPIRQLRGSRYASISLGANKIQPYQKRINSYVDCDHFNLPKGADLSAYTDMLNKLSGYDIILVSVHDMSRQASREFGIVQGQRDFINTISSRKKALVTLFGSPYATSYFEGVPNLIVAYEEDVLAQEAASQAIFGATDITGKMPVTASAKFPVGHGIHVPSLGRIGFAAPEAVGLNSDTLSRIEEIVGEMIKEKAAPGCQVLVAKDGKIVYHEAFGHHTYDNKVKVQKEHMYDVASVTKVMASTISAMHLQDRDLFNINQPVAQYIPEEDTTTKAPMIYEDMLSHVAGLAGWIPFYKNTLEGEKSTTLSDEYYRDQKSPDFEVMVTPNLYLRSDYPDTIWRRIFSSGLRDDTNYRYSDLAFYIMNKTVENISGYQVDGYAEINFYAPLGLRRTMFNPHRIYDKDELPPSEFDQYWRNQVVQGTVHDMGAAMLGGVSGHAGLFSNSLELAVLAQMLLNNGYYGGRQYIQPKTIDLFTKRHWRSTRRGIGFDMKELDPDKSQNMSEKASRNAFGHLGFTGTAVFADPDHDIVYVFLSNRTYPTMRNNKLGKGDYRPRIQSVIYDAMILE